MAEQTACPSPDLKEHTSDTERSGRHTTPDALKQDTQPVPGQSILRVGQELVERVLVVLQTHHRHQEALDHFPRLPPVVRLGVGALQAV